LGDCDGANTILDIVGDSGHIGLAMYNLASGNLPKTC
jgi:hypothetical protein